MIATYLPQRQFRRMPWKNGGGMTVDIAARRRPDAPEDDWSGVLWRFGRTAIVEPGPFSDLAGYDRLQTVIVGSGLVLDHAGGEIDLRRPFAVARYDGGLPVTSRLEAGPVEVLNLIADRTRHAIGLVVLKEGETARAGPGVLILYAPDGPVEIELPGELLSIPGGDAVETTAGTEIALSCRAGLVVLASVRPVADAD